MHESCSCCRSFVNLALRDIRLVFPSRAGWAFGLLVAAWVCANSPQAACYTIGDWLMGAGHFSHQARLTEEVTAILKNGAVETTTLAAADRERVETRSTAARTMPPDAVLKKVELAAVSEAWRGGENFSTRVIEIAQSWTLPEGAEREVPYPPPRDV